MRDPEEERESLWYLLWLPLIFLPLIVAAAKIILALSGRWGN